MRPLRKHRHFRRTVGESAAVALLVAAASPVWAQPPSPSPSPTPLPPVVSPEVHADRTVTFRFRAPSAKRVMLAREGTTPRPMEKDDQGVWSLTTEALEPDLYGYAFVTDGVALIDPSNAMMKPNLLNSQSVVHVPGPASLPWEVGDVPRGTVHHHFYRSKVVGDQRDFYVYTPPGYDAAAARPYPVLYLLHGYSDDASGWTAVGRAHVILDNLIAQGKARPMLVVTPLGYGAPEIVTPNWGGIRDPGLRRKNYDRFGDALLGEVLPEVERSYRAAKDRESRAIAGLSMGGAESLLVGLNALDRFAWVGAFSSGGVDEDFDAAYPGLAAANQPGGGRSARTSTPLRLLWIACGTEDRLIEPNRKLRDWLTAKGVTHTFVETPGAHTWMVWRRNLAMLAPLLFGGPAASSPRAR
ncbi:MAG: esterase [Acidobacteria bacterium]|nr:MAG: esterase [Acidobacteriota bacterium]